MKPKFLLLLLTLSTSLAYSQPANVNAIAKMTGDTLQGNKSDKAWYSGGFLGLNFGQVSLSKWAPGGENSYSVNGSFNGFANYDKGRIRWDNNLLLSYALLNTASNGTRKTDDQIDYTSKFGYRFSKHPKWYYSALLNFESQMTSGYDYPDDSTVISKFLSPAYLTSSIGITWRPTDYFEVLISPVTSKVTMVMDDKIVGLSGRYGVAAGENTRSEFGAYLNARFRKEIMTNVTLASRLELFNNYADKNTNNHAHRDKEWREAQSDKFRRGLSRSEPRAGRQSAHDTEAMKRKQRSAGFRRSTSCGCSHSSLL